MSEPSNSPQARLSLANDRFVDRFVFPLLRGGFAGVIGVAALAVWAVNFEAFVNARGRDGLAFSLFRLAVADAIPLAVLLLTLAWLGRGGSSEGLLRSIVDSLLMRSRATESVDPEDDRGFQID